VRLVLAQWGARTGAGRQRADLYAGVAEQQAKQLTAGISGRSGDRYLEHHLHDYAIEHKIMHSRMWRRRSDRLA
jgi:hypothetical protein